MKPLGSRTMFFDTLQISKDLQESFSPQQFEALARVFAQAGGDQLATKLDVSTLRVGLANVFGVRRILPSCRSLSLPRGLC